MEEPHVHVLTSCKACSLRNFSGKKSGKEVRTYEVNEGIPEVPATYTFMAEQSHEVKYHKEDMATRLFNKFPKHKPFYNPMISRIIEFRHGSEHNG